MRFFSLCALECTIATLIAFFITTVVAQQTAPGSSLPDPIEPEAFTQVTFHLLTSNISVIGNYSVMMHYNPVPGDIPNILAVLIYNKSSDEFGWDFVQVTANEELVNSDEDKGFRAYYAAGYLEAYIAAKRIAQIYISQGLTTPQPQAVLDWVERHIAYMNSKATENMRAGYPCVLGTPTRFGRKLGISLLKLKAWRLATTCPSWNEVLSDHRNRISRLLISFFLTLTTS